MYNVCHNTCACKCNFRHKDLIWSKRVFCRRAKKKLFSQSKAISWVTKNIFSFVPNKSASQLNYFQTHLFRTSFLTCRRHMKWNGVSTPPPSTYFLQYKIISRTQLYFWENEIFGLSNPQVSEFLKQDSIDVIVVVTIRPRVKVCLRYKSPIFVQRHPTPNLLSHMLFMPFE